MVNLVRLNVVRLSGFCNNAPKNVDYLLLEGTSLGREGKPFKNELDIENDLVKVFKAKGKANVVYTSGQNIDRLVSIYREYPIY